MLRGRVLPRRLRLLLLPLGGLMGQLGRLLALLGQLGRRTTIFNSGVCRDSGTMALAFGAGGGRSEVCCGSKVRTGSARGKLFCFR